MKKGLITKKLGIMQLFNDKGVPCAVTVLQLFPTKIIKKAPSNDFIAAIFGANSKRGMRNSAYTKKLEKLGVDSSEPVLLKEIEAFSSKIYENAEISADIFQQNDLVDVSGVSKGKGFAGAMKAHNFSGQRASHGNTKAHKKMGSTGSNQDPGKVQKGKKMPKNLGRDYITQQGLKVFKVEKDLIFIQGSVPGAVNSNVRIISSQLSRIKNRNFKKIS